MQKGMSMLEAQAKQAKPIKEGKSWPVVMCIVQKRQKWPDDCEVLKGDLCFGSCEKLYVENGIREFVGVCSFAIGRFAPDKQGVSVRRFCWCLLCDRSHFAFSLPLLSRSQCPGDGRCRRSLFGFRRRFRHACCVIGASAHIARLHFSGDHLEYLRSLENRIFVSLYSIYL